MNKGNVTKQTIHNLIISRNQQAVCVFIRNFVLSKLLTWYGLKREIKVKVIKDQSCCAVFVKTRFKFVGMKHVYVQMYENIILFVYELLCLLSL